MSKVFSISAQNSSILGSFLDFMLSFSLFCAIHLKLSGLLYLLCTRIGNEWLLFASFFGIWDYGKQRLHHLQCHLTVLNVEDVVRLCSGIGWGSEGVSHQSLNFGQHLHIADIVASKHYGFLIDVDKPIAKHLLGAHTTCAGELGTDELNIFFAASHVILLFRCKN